MRVARAGGFVPRTGVYRAAQEQSTECVFCFADAEMGWLHVATWRLVCTECLPDPDADDGAAGREAQERLIALVMEPVEIW